MKKFKNIFGFCLLVASYCSADVHSREYNVWYEKDAVLYDITQTSDGRPVMISISQAGFKTANMVISYLTEGSCPSESLPLLVNGEQIPSEYVCKQQGHEKLEHYVVRDAGRVNAMVQHLKSDFTLIVQKEIKVWAANINSPKYGIAPKF